MTKEIGSAKEYLNIISSQSRYEFLKNRLQRDEKLPLDLVHDIIHTNISTDEKILLLQLADCSNNLALEDFLTRGLYHWDQNMVSISLKIWDKKTDHLLSHRALPLPLDPKLPQRVSYTLLEACWHGCGVDTIKQFSEVDDLENLSSAFLSLLFYRALQWNFESDRLKNIGKKMLESMNEVSFNLDKALPYIMAYFLRFEPALLSTLNFKNRVIGIWPEIIKSLQFDIPNENTISKIKGTLDKMNSSAGLNEFLDVWPAIWNRNFLPATTVKDTLKKISKYGSTLHSRIPEIFGGIASTTLSEAVISEKSDIVFGSSLKLLDQLITEDNMIDIYKSIEKRAQKTKDLPKFLQSIPKKILMDNDPGVSDIFQKIIEEKSSLADGRGFISPEKSFSFKQQPKREGESVTRGTFIQTAFSNRRGTIENPKDIWEQLTNAWQNPSEDQLETLAGNARKKPFLFQLFYLDTLARFQGIDRAALKILDYIRSESSCVLQSSITALSGIDTQRSLQELVAFLTRPNITFELQMEIAHILQEKNLEGLQSELRSAIEDIHLGENEQHHQWELKETLRSLIQVGVNQSEIADEKQKSLNMPTSSELDKHLEDKIPSYHQLSSEVKRALRTAQFFQLQVESAGNLNNIDLSPAIDMQYKALELSFRENFESPCSILINQGILQRKLDVLGYARPIPQKMEEFENHIENLPTIKDIPFFSRFKLRKMLRALCQYRRGKRFTLDGLKAFGLFFVCFSRSDCKYGLADIFMLEGITDQELFNFVKNTHIFQDFRNRAAHEGFHPDASNDLNKIWDNTKDIIESMFRVKSALAIEDTGYHGQKDKKNDKKPVIVQKTA